MATYKIDPLHSEIKLPGSANAFYQRAVNQHLQIGIEAVDLLRTMRETLGESAKLLIGMDLVKDRNTLVAAYDDATYNGATYKGALCWHHI